MAEGEISTFVGEKYRIDSTVGRNIGGKLKGASIRNLIEVAGMVDRLEDPEEW